MHDVALQTHNHHFALKSNSFIELLSLDLSAESLPYYCTLRTSTSLLKHYSRAFGLLVYESWLTLNNHVKRRTEWSMWLKVVKGAKLLSLLLLLLLQLSFVSKGHTSMNMSSLKDKHGTMPCCLWMFSSVYDLNAITNITVNHNFLKLTNHASR